MEILIKGMEMPTSCGKCKLFGASHAIGLFAPFGWCRVNGKEIFRLSVKADFCPLVEVPPHGRCIDADSQTFPTPHRNPSNDYMRGWNACLRSVQQQPTIIPASQESEE